MEITIKSAKWTPEWETLQLMLCQMTGKNVKLTRIARVDGGVDYRAPGVYEVNYLQYNDHGGSDHMFCKLTVER